MEKLNNHSYTQQFSKMSKLEIIALFAAISVYLSSIEYLLPRPVPFFRFGLANIAILLVIRVFSFRDTCLLVLLKVLGLGILNGTIVSYVFVFSFVGSVGSMCVMLACTFIDKKKLSFMGISVIGAFVSNALQAICAVFFIFGTQAWIIVPYLLSLGTLSGVIVGTLAQYYYQKSKILPVLFTQYSQGKASLTRRTTNLVKTRVKNYTFVKKSRIVEKKILRSGITAPLILLICALGIVIAYVLTSSIQARAVQVVILLLCALRVKRVKIIYFVGLMFSITFFYMLIPNGKVLFNIAQLPITYGALHKGLFKALTLCGYVFLSLCCIRTNLYVPGKIGIIFSTMLYYFYKFWDKSKFRRKKKASVKVSILMRIDTILRQAIDLDATHTDQQRPIPWIFVGLSIIVVYGAYIYL